MIADRRVDPLRYNIHALSFPHVNAHVAIDSAGNVDRLLRTSGREGDGDRSRCLWSL
jgi:hypothetical protein